jgi:RNA polymerase sigma-70 factor (ECF subfamily)
MAVSLILQRQTQPDSRETGRDTDERALSEIFARLARGEAEALSELYEVVADRLYGFALWSSGSAEDADDVVSEVFVKVAEQGDRLAKVRSPKAWLLTLTRRQVVDLARQRKRRPTESLESTELLVAPGDDPDRVLDARRASALLAELPQGQRQVVFLRHYADLAYAAIGKIMGIPTFTAASRYRLAIRRLRRLMEEAP